MTPRPTASREAIAAVLLCAFASPAAAEHVVLSGSPNHRVFAPAATHPVMTGDANHRRFLPAAGAPAAATAARFGVTGAPNHRRFVPAAFEVAGAPNHRRIVLRATD